MRAGTARADATMGRRTAAGALQRVIDEGAFSQRALGAAFERTRLDAVERAWVTATVYGTLADLRAVDLALDRLAARGVDSLPEIVRAHLRIAIWELGRAGRGPDGPIVSAVVEAVKADGRPRLAGLTNGVLRSLIRDRDKVFSPPKKADDTARFGIAHGLPDWIAMRLLARLDDDAADAMAAFNAPSPVGLRVRAGSPDEVANELTEAGLDVRRHPLVANALVCDRGHVAGTVAHREGRIAIQDVGAQLACAALPPSLEGSLLDACAGIGGKTLALVDAYGAANVVASDNNLRKLRALLRRPGLEGVTAIPDLLGDAPADGADDRPPFAAVVVDAPCSALGTLGRHPEVRWNRDESAVAELVALQHHLLDAARARVAQGGYLLYVVCTWTREETHEQVEAFLARHADFALDPPSLPGTLVDDTGVVELWPHRAGTDGFFIARLRRTH